VHFIRAQQTLLQYLVKWSNAGTISPFLPTLTFFLNSTLSSDTSLYS
jgi:hypothetical protein